MLETLDRVVRSLQIFVRDEYDCDLQAELEFGDIGTLFVEQEGCDFDGDLNMQGSRTFFHGLFLQDAQNVQRT